LHQRIRAQACGAATDPVRWRAGASFNVDDDDLAVGRNQYCHHRVPDLPDKRMAASNPE
jgi:hypothetical protein